MLDCVYGDLHYGASNDMSRVVRDWQAGGYARGLFRRGWHPPHPSFFVRRGVYERLGGFRMELRIAADYEFMLRAWRMNGYGPAGLIPGCWPTTLGARASADATFWTAARG